MSNPNRIFTDRAERQNVMLAGEEWEYRIWQSGHDDLNHHSHAPGCSGQIRTLSRSDAGYRWDFAWVVHLAPGDQKSPYIVARNQGAAATLEEVARIALDYQPAPIEIAGMVWYPDCGKGYLAMTPEGREALIRVHEGGFRWELDFHPMTKLAGLDHRFDGARLKGTAISLEDAALAVQDAPAAFRASLRALLAEMAPA